MARNEFPHAGPKSADLFAATQQRPLRAFHVCKVTLPLRHAYVNKNLSISHAFMRGALAFSVPLFGDFIRRAIPRFK